MTKSKAGRKRGSGPYGEPTKVVRLPESKVDTVKAFLDAGTYTLPFVDYKVPAGFPSPAGDYQMQELNLFEHIITNPPATFLMQVQGESMRDAGILDGAILVVDRSLTPSNGDIIIAEVNGEMTVKRLRLQNGQGWLLPENSDFSPMRVDDKEVFILGVVTWWCNRARRKSGFSEI